MDGVGQAIFNWMSGKWHVYKQRHRSVSPTRASKVFVYFSPRKCEHLAGCLGAGYPDTDHAPDRYANTATEMLVERLAWHGNIPNPMPLHYHNHNHNHNHNHSHNHNHNHNHNHLIMNAWCDR